MNSFIEMLKDPGTQEIIAGILTQIVAFLIFLWILRKFAWTPILRLLDERRNKIASEFERIDSLEDKFNNLKADYEKKMNQIDQEARQKLQEAVDEGRTFAREITDKARDEAKLIIEKTNQNIQIEMDKAKIELKNYIIDLSIKSSERLLHEKLDDEKHKSLLAKFISEIEKGN